MKNRPRSCTGPRSKDRVGLKAPKKSQNQAFVTAKRMTSFHLKIPLQKSPNILLQIAQLKFFCDILHATVSTEFHLHFTIAYITFHFGDTFN